MKNSQVWVYSGIDMGAHRMFFHGHFFPEKVEDLFSRRPQTQVLTVTGNAQNTLQHSRGREGASALKTRV